MPVERAYVIPPHSQIGPLAADKRMSLIATSPMGSRYAKTVDRESAYELLKKRVESAAIAKQEQEAALSREKQTRATRSRRVDSPGDSLMKGAARAIGSQLGREVVRGILGGLFGGRKR